MTSYLITVAPTDYNLESPGIAYKPCHYSIGQYPLLLIDAESPEAAIKEWFELQNLEDSIGDELVNDHDPMIHLKNLKVNVFEVTQTQIDVKAHFQDLIREVEASLKAMEEAQFEEERQKAQQAERQLYETLKAKYEKK